MDPGSRSLRSLVRDDIEFAVQALSFPRQVFARVVHFVGPLRIEGAGKAGRRLRPQHRVQKTANNAHGFDRYSRDIPTFPAQWLYGLYVLSPVSGLFCHRRQLGLTSGLTPGSRRQDHTISPYATLLRPAADLDPFRKSSRYAWDCRV